MDEWEGTTEGVKSADESVVEAQSALGKAAQLLSATREQVEADLNEMPLDAFLQKHVTGRQFTDEFLPLFVEMYRCLEVNSPDEFHALLQQARDQRHAAAAEKTSAEEAESFTKAAEAWDNLVKRIDATAFHAEQHGAQDFVGFDVSKVKLIDTETKEEVQLGGVLNPHLCRYTLFVLMRFYGCPFCQRHVLQLYDASQRFAERGCKLVVVCKGSGEGGGKWRRLVGVDLPVLADEHADFVRQMRFGRSVCAESACRIPHLLAEMESRGELHPSAVVEDSLSDVYQLGGDVLVDSRGRVLFVYRSRSADDRPSVQYLLDQIPARPATSASATLSPAAEPKHSKSCLIL